MRRSFSALAVALLALAGAAPPAAALSVSTFAEDGRDPLGLHPNGGQAQWSEPVETPYLGTYGAGEGLRVLAAVSEGTDGFSFTLEGPAPFRIVLEAFALFPGLAPAPTTFRLLEETGGVFSPLASLTLTPPSAGPAALFPGLTLGPGLYGVQAAVEDKTGESGATFDLLIAPVPAPPALAPMLLGLAGLVALHRRRGGTPARAD